MTISLYDTSVASYLQGLKAVKKFLAKGKAHCEENDIDLQSIVETRLIPDMLPFRFQIISVAHHSVGAMRAIELGEFRPPSGFPDYDYEGLQGLIDECIEELEKLSPESVNLHVDKPMVFLLGGNELPFTAANFVLTFSLPNFHFHAATAYDMLRMKGTPLGKRDFLGRLRMEDR